MNRCLWCKALIPRPRDDVDFCDDCLERLRAKLPKKRDNRKEEE